MALYHLVRDISDGSARASLMIDRCHRVPLPEIFDKILSRSTCTYTDIAHVTIAGDFASRTMAATPPEGPSLGMEDNFAECFGEHVNETQRNYSKHFFQCWQSDYE